jgi:hypothetical protein
LAHYLGGIRGAVFCLTIQVLGCFCCLILGCFCCLINDALNLHPGIPGGATESLALFAPEVSCGANYAIFIHRSILDCDRGVPPDSSNRCQRDGISAVLPSNFAYSLSTFSDA